jgi:vacuolar-type H+-ATPase subunit I/STV1
MDHDAVIAALNRTTRFLTKEENLFNWKVRQLESNFNDDKEEQTRKFERMIRERDTEIEELKRQLQQEKLATSNLALKVIQSEKVLQQKIVLDRRLGKMEGELLDLNAANSSRKTKITELEEIIVSDRKTIMALTEVIETLRLQLTAICEEEEQFVADNLAQAEANLKAMFENQYVFLKETGKRKKLMRERLSRLGISLSASMSEEDEEDGGECGDEEPAEEPSDDEVARLALQSAMQAVKPLIQHEED